MYGTFNCKEGKDIHHIGKMIKSLMSLKYIFVKLTLTLLAARSLAINIIKNIWWKEYFKQFSSYQMVFFIGNNITFVLAKAERSIVITCQCETITNLFLAFLFFLFLDSAISPRRKLQGGGPQIPSISGRDATRHVGEIRFDVFADKPRYKNEESDNEPIILFKRGNSPAICSFLFLFSFFIKNSSMNLEHFSMFLI